MLLKRRMMFLGTETDVFGDGGTKTLPLGNVFLLRPQKHQPPFPKTPSQNINEN